MQKPTKLKIAVHSAGGDPDKVRVHLTVDISDAEPAMTDLNPVEREAVLKGALDGIRSALPEGLDAQAAMTRTEVVPLV